MPNLEELSSGSDVYAIGSPASRDLAFSITRGIVSGIRTLNGMKFLQTDASVSPGNSGGPLVGADGRAVAVVSWKVAASAFEGIAFGVPMAQALQGLGLVGGAQNGPQLLVPDAGAAPQPVAAVVDTPDPIPSLDPQGEPFRKQRAREEAERRRAADEVRKKRELERAREAWQAENTPAYVDVMQWGGASLALVGGLAVLWTATEGDDPQTRAEYEKLVTLNDLSWVALGTGAAAFTISFLLVPEPPKTLPPARAARMSLELAPGFIRAKASY